MSAADLMGHYPERLALIGCQPLDLENWGGPLTDPVFDVLEKAVETARDILAQWGVEFVPRVDALEQDEALLTHNIDLDHYERRVG